MAVGRVFNPEIERKKGGTNFTRTLSDLRFLLKKNEGLVKARELMNNSRVSAWAQRVQPARTAAARLGLHHTRRVHRVWSATSLAPVSAPECCRSMGSVPKGVATLFFE